MVGFVDASTVEESNSSITADSSARPPALEFASRFRQWTAPLAFDNFPILSEPFDQERLFSFYIGLSR